MILLTDKAIAKIEEISNEEGIGHYTIRVKIQGGGCAGFSYDLFFDDQESPLDEVSEFDGVKVISDPLSFQYVDGVVIDYVEGPINSGFKFNNPNVTSVCGCGSSFSA